PFDWGYKKHRIAELNATTEQKATAERDVEQRILLEVEEKFRKLGEARLLLDALTDQREADQTKLREVTDRYNQKAALVSDLMQQQAGVSQAEAQYQQALAGFWTARADFEKAIGMEYQHEKQIKHRTIESSSRTIGAHRRRKRVSATDAGRGEVSYSC